MPIPHPIDIAIYCPMEPTRDLLLVGPNLSVFNELSKYTHREPKDERPSWHSTAVVPYMYVFRRISSSPCDGGRIDR